jgi:uncharacterized protein YecT (DUF1311 family)
MKKLFIGIIIIGVLSQLLSARDEYDRTFDSIYVSQKIYYSLDAKLNKVFSKLKKKLSAKGKQRLKWSEAKWIKKRNRRCAFPETNSVNIECAVSETRARLHFLEDRVRECEEIGCKIKKL